MMIYFLIAILTVAAMCDLVYAKIPNNIILTGLIISLICSVCINGLDGTGECFAGMCLSLLAGIVVYAFGVLGAGDIKLICVVGAFLGVRGVLGSIWYAFLISIAEGGLKYLFIVRWRWYPNEKMTIRFALPLLLGTLGNEIINKGVMNVWQVRL